MNQSNEFLNAAQHLIEAAHEFWMLYQQQYGSAAVVWVDSVDGHFVLFTRGEYKQGILEYAKLIAETGQPMEHPFEVTP